MSQIIVDEISSIGESYFSMKLKGKIIKDGALSRFCRLKGGKDTYHISENDLRKMNDYSKDFFPYKWANGYQHYRHLTKNQYIDLMKYTIYWYIEKGELGRLLTSISENEFDIDITWESSSLKTPKKPSYSQVPL